jgi:ATP-independent RNA helicase DbpA
MVNYCTHTMPGVDCLHGDKDQSERNSVMKRFARSSKMMENSDSSDNSPISILVATDIASRGLDIKDIRTVVNYEVKPNI